MKVLLDTVALIRIALGEPLAREGREAMETALSEGELFVSAMSAWELCLLERTGKTVRLIGGDGGQFFRNIVARTGIRVLPLDENMAIESRRLPGQFHNDPGDRFLVATARVMNLPLMTDDDLILEYSKLGHVHTILC
jgi:PIN domain nuclease of toxin-antitoxin system